MSRGAPAIRITLSVPLVDLPTHGDEHTRIASPLDWRRSGKRLHLPPGHAPFVKSLGHVRELRGPQAILPGGPRLQVDAQRMIRFAYQDEPATSVLRSNLLTRSVIAERDGVAMQLRLQFSWRNRGRSTSARLSTLVHAVRSLAFLVDGRTTTMAELPARVAGALSARVHPHQGPHTLTSGRPIAIIEARPEVLELDVRAPTRARLDLGNQGEISAHDIDGDWVILVRKPQLHAVEMTVEALTFAHSNVQAMLELQAAREAGDRSRDVRSAMMARVKWWSQMGTDGLRATWPPRLVSFYDRISGRALSAIAEDAEIWDKQLGARIVNIKGDNNVYVGDNSSMQNVQVGVANSYNHSDREQAVNALEMLAASNEHNQALLAGLIASLQNGKTEKSALAGIWAALKGGLQVVPSAVGAVAAIEGFFGG